MSKHRIKSVAYHEDDFDDYDDYDDPGYQEDNQDALTAEDREQLRLGTLEVRQALGAAHPATDYEIQEALWHYYYDVGKSVTFLKSMGPFSRTISRRCLVDAVSDKHKHRSPTNKTKTYPAVEGEPNVCPGFFKRCMRNQRQIAYLASQYPYRCRWRMSAMTVSDERYQTPASSNCPRPLSARQFFEDCPWFNVPAQRRAEILVESLYPRGRLLGGAPAETRMSKLAALAARRRQKENTKPSVSEQEEGEKPSEDYATSLNKLRISATPSTKRRLSKDTNDDTRLIKITTDEKIKGFDTGGPLPVTQDQEPLAAQEDEQVTVLTTNLAAQPSLFANVIMGPGPCLINQVSDPLSILTPDDLITKKFHFTEPSPDDKVARAQNAKGQPWCKV